MCLIGHFYQDELVLFQEYLDDNDQVSLELFQEKVWPSIKDIYKKDGATEGDSEEVSPA